MHYYFSMTWHISTQAKIRCLLTQSLIGPVQSFLNSYWSVNQLTDKLSLLLAVVITYFQSELENQLNFPA